MKQSTINIQIRETITHVIHGNKKLKKKSTIYVGGQPCYNARDAANIYANHISVDWWSSKFFTNQKPTDAQFVKNSGTRLRRVLPIFEKLFKETLG